MRFPPELQQQCHASLRVHQGICGFPSRLSQEAFPRGFPTGLSHVTPWCESILGLKVEAVQGKQVSLGWTETSRGLWEWWHDPGVPLAFPVESASSSIRIKKAVVDIREVMGNHTELLIGKRFKKKWHRNKIKGRKTSGEISVLSGLC